MFRKDIFIMKKRISAASSSSSLFDSVTNLLSKFLNKFIDTLFSDDDYDKKTDDKVSDETKKAAEEARKKNRKDKATKTSSDENDEQSKDEAKNQESSQVFQERTVVTPKDGTEDSDTFTIERFQWPDTKDWFISVKNERTGKTKSEYIKNPSESTIQKTIEELKAEVTASKRIKVALNRIVGESEDTVDITAIKCSYDLGSAYTDICAVLDDDEFLDTVPEGESAYEILPLEDDYVVDGYAGEVCSDDIYTGAFDCATVFYTCLFYLQINRNTVGNEFNCLVESLKYSAQYQMETIAKWAKMHNDSAEIMLCYCSECCDTECLDSWSLLKTSLSDYKNCLEALYSCANHEEQSVIDGWILDIDYALYSVDTAMQ